MRTEFAPLFSGSNGNALYVRMAGARILIDAGRSGTQIAGELRRLGVEPADLDALLVTHEHMDHIAGVGVLSRRYHLPVYATEGTWDGMAPKIGAIAPENRRVLRAGQDFYIGGADVMPFAIPHDANDPVGYALSAAGVKVATATDIGHVSEKWMGELDACDILLLESNHDPDMLKAGSYPYELKRRILGAKGHLSNEQAGQAALALVKRSVKRIVLGHLSGENNFPEMAYRTVACVLAQGGVQPGEDVFLEVARRDAACAMYCLDDGDTRLPAGERLIHATC